MTKRFWLSFADRHGFLGVCIVEVDEDDAMVARDIIKRMHPYAPPNAEWLGAAIQKAHEMGCNPGGSVGSCELPASLHDTPSGDPLPLDRLLSHAQLKELGLL